MLWPTFVCLFSSSRFWARHWVSLFWTFPKGLFSVRVACQRDTCALSCLDGVLGSGMHPGRCALGPM